MSDSVEQAGYTLVGGCLAGLGLLGQCVEQVGDIWWVSVTGSKSIR